MSLPFRRHLRSRHLFLLLAVLVPLLARAHAANQSYVFLRIMDDSITGSVQINVDDINKVLDLGLSRGMTDEEIRTYAPRIREYLQSKLDFSSSRGRHPVVFTGRTETFRINRLGLILGFDFYLAELPEVPDEIDVSYRAVYHADPTHRGFTVVEYNWKAGVHGDEANIQQRFGPGDSGPQALDLREGSVWTGFRAMVVSGMYHIYIGLDHILFLIALVLPAVVYRVDRERKVVGAAGAVVAGKDSVWRGSHWRPVERFRPAFIYILKIVTFFTIAHTITLSMAALGWVSLPSYLVESLIALSIALAAAHNIYPLFRNDGVIIAFVFGLFHGFGFASVLGDVGLRGEFMTLSLLGFNLGVELAQLLIISIAFPILFALRRFRFYRYLLVGGSVLLILIALYWFIERFFGVNIPGYDLVDWILSLFGYER